MASALLPAALQAWSQWLNWFDAPIASALGDLLLRLEPLLGRRSTSHQRGKVDPDGIDDLRLRGNYERLLLSEWALADALPDEFMRRAAHNEHLFLAPRQVTRQAEGLIVAIFDAGPTQWGPPRLVHVAMWILLARRAQRTRTRFAWGLSHLPGELHDADTPVLLQQLLRARTHTLADAEHWQAWAAFLAKPQLASAERWLIAASEDENCAASHVCLTRRGFDQRLALTLGGRRTRQQVALDLPANTSAAGLLTGEFLKPSNPAAHRSTQGRFSLRQAPLLSLSGRYVAVPMLGEHRALIFAVETRAAHKTKARSCNWSTGSELLCAALSEKNFGGVIADKSHLYFWKIQDFSTPLRPPSDELTITPGLDRWLSCVWLNSGGRTHRFALLDNAGHLLCWTNERNGTGQKQRTHQLVDSDVLKLMQADAQHLIYARHAGGHLEIKTLHREGANPVVARWPMPIQPGAVWLRGRFQAGKWQGDIASEERIPQRGGGRTTICRLFEIDHTGSPRELESVVTAGKLVGMIRSPAEAFPELLTLRADRRALIGISSQGMQILYESSSDILTVSTSIDGNLIALVNLDGQLVVAKDGGRQLLMCVSGSGADA